MIKTKNCYNNVPFIFFYKNKWDNKRQQNLFEKYFSEYVYIFGNAAFIMIVSKDRDECNKLRGR